MAKTKTSIPLLWMYTASLYEAIEDYASHRNDRSKYDAIIELATKQANDYLKKNNT